MSKRGNAKLPSSAEEGWPKAGVVVAKRIPMISTTPSAPNKVALRFFLMAQPSPPRLRRGVCGALMQL